MTRTYQKRFYGAHPYQYRQIWEWFNPPLPSPCHFCSEPVETFGCTKWAGVVHHRDHDRSNYVPWNLALAHTSCHASSHMRENWRDDAYRSSQSAACRAGWTPEARQRLSEAMQRVV